MSTRTLPETSAPGAIRVLVVADDDAVRTSVGRLLQAYPQFRVVGEARSGAEGVQEACTKQPDAVVLDVRIRDMSSADAVSEILHHLPQTRVILLSGYAEDHRLWAALAAGADGYVLKRIGIQELAARIESAVRRHPLRQ